MQERKLKTATHVNRIFLEHLCFPGMVAIDATLGKGNDALFLLEKSAPNGRLYGFDIQNEAIEITAKKLECAIGEAAERATLIGVGHENIVHYVKEPIDLAIFNLGYLPSGDKSITTMVQTTLEGICQAFDCLKIGGILMVTVYPGHTEGEKEAQVIEAWLKSQPQQIADVLHYQFVNHQNAPPHTFILEKRALVALHAPTI